MDGKKTIEVIKMLADGIDPNTGEVFPADSPYQNPQTIRALFTAIEALEISERRKDRKRTLPEKAGAQWTDEESKVLAEEYDSRMPIAQIARSHRRTQVAIAARLVGLGKIDSRDEAFMRVRPNGL